MKIFYLLLLLLIGTTSMAQENRFSIEANYGLAGNHFVGSYIEDQDDGDIPDGYYFISKKDFLGTVSQLQLNYHLKNNTSLSLGYARDIHQREVNHNKNVGNAWFIVDNFAIRHNNNIYFLKHKRNLSKDLKYHFGLFHLQSEQQEIDIDYNTAVIQVQERDTPNNNLNEGGVLAGLDYEKQIDTKFTAGLHLSGYYIATASTYETTYLTGSIAYAFGK